MSYQRVLPRDLFNEAKLLKCLGRLVLMIHDGMLPELVFVRNPVDSEEPFEVLQRIDDGALVEDTISFYLSNGSHPLGGWHGIARVRFHCPYNSKDNYPLMFQMFGSDDEGLVFNEDGSFTDEFLTAIGREKQS